MIEIKVAQKLPTPAYPQNPRFGTAFTPHMLQLDIDTSKDTSFHSLTATIRPLAEGEKFTASSVIFHYGQSIFEGMKAFGLPNNEVAIFRADLHARRFKKSSQMLAMPEMPEEIFTHLLTEYVKFEKESVPTEKDHALYLRPLMIARDEIVKVGRSKKYSFYILACVVGSYFTGGQGKPAKVLVCKDYVRAVPGGLGEAKTAANYAASLAPQAHAEKLGCDQVLYLDAVNHDLVDELGGMNFFIVKNNELITPKLNGSILHGVTRQSILEVASRLDIKASEQNLSFNEIVQGIKEGSVTEAFACGTAAVIHPIGEFIVLDKKTSTPQRVVLPEIPAGKTKVASELLQILQSIQRGVESAPGQWLFKV